MTPQQQEQLADLLVMAAKEGEPDRPAGYIPEVCLKPFYKGLTTTPFVELIVYRKTSDGQFEYLYQDRHDQWWDGFCAIGGMVRKEHPAGLVDIAQSIIEREFKGESLTVRTLQIVSAIKWRVHPWCNPYATACVIQLAGKIPERKDLHWLRVDNLPKEMVQNHREYLLQCERFLKHGALIFTPTDPYGIGVHA